MSVPLVAPVRECSPSDGPPRSALRRLQKPQDAMDEGVGLAALFLGDWEVLEGGHPVAPPVAPFVGDRLEVARASKLLRAEAFGHLACELRDVTLLGCLDENSLHAERLQLGRSRLAAFRIPL